MKQDGLEARGQRPEKGRCRILMAIAAILAASSASTAPVYRAKNAEVSKQSVKCRIAGTEVLEGDVFAGSDFWEIKNYGNRLGIEVGKDESGVAGLCISGSAKDCDTAWSATSGKISLKGKGKRFRLGFSVYSTINIKPRPGDGAPWKPRIFWYKADGSALSDDPLVYSVVKCRHENVEVYGGVPEGAAAFSLRLGFDWPNIGPDNRIVYSGLSFEELSEPAAYAAEAEFVSEVRAGGKISWLDDVPHGCAVRFQWRGAGSAEELAAVPFSGPGGNESGFFTKPFMADAKFMQYRAVLVSNGRATPALREVTIGVGPSVRTDRDWEETGDVKSPDVRRLSPSPTDNPAETLRIGITDSTAVLWTSLEVSVDGRDMTSSFARSGGVIALPAPTGGWSRGLHRVDVSVADFHGNRMKRTKMFYVGKAPLTPKVSLRDDGMTLIDGKAFFPIGLYAVCKRPFNGNCYDTAFKGLKDGGFNMAHTYGNSYDPGFLAAAEKYGVKLWVAARFPDKRLVEQGRHNPNIIAWYLGDDTSDHILPEQEADYDEAVKAVDPTRITVQADPIFNSTGGPSRYADYVTATDGFMPEIYPIRKGEGDPTDKTCVAAVVRDMKQFAEDVRLHGNGRKRTCWAIIQYFKGWTNWGHFPSREQLFATTFASIIHGAHGITWYTYGGFRENEGVTSTPERWRNICDLARRLSELTPVLVERTLPQPARPKVVSGPKTDAYGESSVTCLLKRHGDWDCLFAVNATAEPVSALLPAAGAKDVQVLYENRSCAVSDGFIRDDFEGFAVHVYKWRNKR